MDKDATASKNGSMPKKIGQLVGATKTHEIVFEGERIKKKNLPNECSCQPMKIKVGRQIATGREKSLTREEMFWVILTMPSLSQEGNPLEAKGGGLLWKM